jgi:signal transduction histidine kinase
VCVDSRLGEGATFTVELPLQPAKTADDLAPLAVS